MFAAGPQCEERGPEPDAGRPDGGRRDSGTTVKDAGGTKPSNDGGWDPSLPDGGFPGSGRNGDPGTTILFLVRMDRGIANYAPLYQRVVDDTRRGLTSAGLTVLETVVASQIGGELFWAQSRDNEPAVPLTDVLTYWAQNYWDVSLKCSVSGASVVGLDAPIMTLTYPTELTGLPVYEHPFFTRPGAFLVVLIEQDQRFTDPYSTLCLFYGGNAVDWFGSQDPAQWLTWQLPRAQTRFWAISTPEGFLDVNAERSACLAQGFPPTALDVIAPSTVSFYDPWAAGMNAYAPRLVERGDFCAAMTGSLPAQDWAAAWAKVLRAQVGLP